MGKEYRVVSERRRDKIEQYHYVGKEKYNYIPEESILKDIANDHIRMFRRSSKLYSIKILETKVIIGKV